MSAKRRQTWTPLLFAGCVSALSFGACSSATKKQVMTPGFGDSGSAGVPNFGGDAGAPAAAGKGGAGGAGGAAGSDAPGAAGDGGFGGALTGIGAAGQSNTADAGAAGATHGAHDHVYQTITALYDALDGEQLGNGDTWTVRWSADARVTSAGAISGSITAGVPKPSVLDQGALPLKLFASKDWVTEGPAADFSFDADGYPVTQAVNSGANAVQLSIKLAHSRYAFARFTSARMRIAQDVTGAAVYTGVAMTLSDNTDQEALIGNHFVEVGGGSMSVAMDYYTGGVETLSNGSPSSSTRVFDGIWAMMPSTPFSSTLTVTNQLFNLSNAVQGQRSEVITGHGDWSTNTGLQYSAGMRVYIAPGGTGSSSAVGVSLEVQRYTP